MAQPERSKTERGSEGSGLALSAGAHSKIFPGEGRFGYVIVCCVLARCLDKELKCSFFVMAYSALFDIVIRVVANLLKPLTSVLYRSLLYPIVPSSVKIREKKVIASILVESGRNRDATSTHNWVQQHLCAATTRCGYSVYVKFLNFYHF